MNLYSVPLVVQGLKLHVRDTPVEDALRGQTWRV